jgi:phytanoyl-CoA hydroxylase
MSAVLAQRLAISTAQRLQYESRGFLHIKQLLDPATTARVRQAFDRVENTLIAPVRAKEKRNYYDVTNILDQDRVFCEIAVYPQLLPYLVTAIGDDVQLLQANARVFPYGDTFTAPWHSDMANTLGIEISQSLNFHCKVHYFFEDLHPDQGCLAFLPGTHRRPRDMARPDPSEIDEKQDAVVIVPKAGDVVIFNTHCLHMCLDNKIQKDRRNLIYAFSHFWVKQFAGGRPSDLTGLPDGTLEQQIFGIGQPGLEPFDQRPWQIREPSLMERMKRKVARGLLDT